MTPNFYLLGKTLFISREQFRPFKTYHPKHLIQLLKELYEDQSAVIRTEFGDTDRFKIKKE